MKFINDILTGVSGEDYCGARVAWFLGIIVFLLLSLINSFKGNPFDPMNWGTGYGALLGGGGIATYAKSKVEP